MYYRTTRKVDTFRETNFDGALGVNFRYLKNETHCSQSHLI